jgi:diacylglycerol kinase family enzyme
LTREPRLSSLKTAINPWDQPLRTPLKVRIETYPKLAVNIDGEIVNQAPEIFSQAPEALNVLVQEGSAAALQNALEQP